MPAKCKVEWEGRLDKQRLIFSKGKNLLTYHPSRRLVISLIGNSGSGKGTQGEILSKLYGIPHISIGDLFREEHRRGTEVAKIDSTYKNSYAPDELCLGLLCRRLAAEDCRNGFILDGFPRTAGQEQILINTLLRPADTHIPIYMDLSERVIKERLTSRYICPECGHQVRGHDSNTSFCPKPHSRQVKLERRLEDVDEDKLQKKFDIFNQNKDGILIELQKAYQVSHLRLHGKESIQDVLQAIVSEVDEVFEKCCRTGNNEQQPALPAPSVHGQQPQFTSLYQSTLLKNKKLLLSTLAAGTAIVGGALWYKRGHTYRGYQ